MSTLRSTARLLNVNRPPRLLVALALGLSVATGLAGCSALRTGSTDASSKTKTFLSVGDKPLPVVSGPPGSSLAADTGTEAPSEPLPGRRRARPDGRISGRVYDAEGRPVPDARVRLADSGAVGGKVVSALTDASGAFTLHGLRPGSDYTVIAEWEGQDGLMTGRIEARTSDTEVKIGLEGEGDAPLRAAKPARINRVSDRDATDDNDNEPGAFSPAERSAPAARVNEEDLPPAPEAETMAPIDGSTVRPRGSYTERRSLTGSDRWKSGSVPAPASASTPRSETSKPRDAETDPLPPALENRKRQVRPPADPEVAPVDPEARGSSAPEGDAPPLPLDDDVNPLPPALERPPETSTSIEPDPAPKGSIQLAATTTDPDLALLDEAPSVTRRTAASPAFERLATSDEPRTLSTPLDTAPGARVVAPETYGPVAEQPTKPFVRSLKAEAMPAMLPEPAAAPAQPKTNLKPSLLGPIRPRSTPRPATTTTTTTTTTATEPRPEKPPARTATRERKRPKWGEVTASATPSPAGSESGSTAAAATVAVASAKPEAIPATLSEPATPKSGDARHAVAYLTDDSTRSDPNARPVKVSYNRPECEYDDRLRRIIDFKLPDLNGKPVRFKEIDADLVLIDFWGTWCQPCVRSIPHLVELQKRMGRRLVVLGIACEAETPEAASPKVAETIRRLNVNYPVLLSSNDGSCPLQEALHIQAFPTMVLVDREGRILWRDQGATPATLARLDRILALSSKDETARR